MIRAKNGVKTLGLGEQKTPLLAIANLATMPHSDDSSDDDSDSGLAKRTAKNDDDDDDEEEGEDEYVIEKIVDRRCQHGDLQYLIKWKDYPDDENTWEPLPNIEWKEGVEAFDKRYDEERRAKKREKKREAPAKRQRIIESDSSDDDIVQVVRQAPSTSSAAKKKIDLTEDERNKIVGALPKSLSMSAADAAGPSSGRAESPSDEVSFAQAFRIVRPHVKGIIGVNENLLGGRVFTALLDDGSTTSVPSNHVEADDGLARMAIDYMWHDCAPAFF